jgi:uncharacterized membrane protein
MKKYLLTGLIILCPIMITVWIINWLFDFITLPFIGLIEHFIKHFGLAPNLHPFLVFGLRVCMLGGIFAFILVLGYAGQKLLLKWLISFADSILLKTPIVKTIYRLVTEIVKPILSPDTKPFKRAVAMKFPTETSIAIGLETGDAPRCINKSSSSKLKTVFMPTAPHPISGFLLITEDANLKEIDISIEDVFKILVSCGNYHPDES